MKSSTKVILTLLLGFSVGWIACIDFAASLVAIGFPLLSWPFFLVSSLPFFVMVWFLLSGVCRKSYWKSDKELQP